MTTTKITQLPVTEARRQLTDILDKLDPHQIIVLVKNYQPKALLVSPEWLDEFSDLMLIREQVWGKYSKQVGDALDKLSIQTKSSLPKLLRS